MTKPGRLIRAVAVLTAGAAMLAACAGLPTSGPVNPGVPADEVADAPFLYYPGGPAVGATPEQIVSGFVEAATSPAEGWTTAREFLTSAFAADWEPDAHVTIDVPSARAYDAARLEDEGIVEVSVEPVATVDERGVYRVSDTTQTELAFELEQREDGEWRISRAPAGIVLDRDVFPDVYHDYTLQYYDPTWSYLVPDVRWYPAEASESRIAAELLRGPSPYVAGGVKTAFPRGTQLAAAGVVVDGSTGADITLTQDAAAADGAQTSRMRAQIAASLASFGVLSVRLHAGGGDLTAEAHVPTSTRPDSRALVLGDTGYDEGFGFLDAGGSIDDLSSFGNVADEIGDVTSISLSSDRTALILQDEAGVVSRRTTDGGAPLDQRDNLIEPTLDPQGFPWSVPEDAPDELVAYTQDYQPLPIDNAFDGAQRVLAMQVSPDGARMAALISTESGTWAVVIPVIRDTDGTPTALGEPVGVTALDGAGIDVAWLDDSSIGIVARDSAGIEVVHQQIGGPATRMSAESDTTGITAGSQQTVARLLSDGGTMYVRRGSTWQAAATGIDVLGTQLGSPRD